MSDDVPPIARHLARLREVRLRAEDVVVRVCSSCLMKFPATGDRAVAPDPTCPQCRREADR